MSTKTDTKTNKNMTDNKTENTNDINGEITSHNQIHPSFTYQFLEKKYTEKELLFGCQNFFHKWNPPTIQNPTQNVQRLFEHMESLNWDNDDKQMELMNYLFENRKLFKEVMSTIDELEEEIIKNNPKFDEDDYDQLSDSWMEYWLLEDMNPQSPLYPLFVNFISCFYPTLYNEYIQYLINGQNITDEYVSGYGEGLLRQKRVDNNDPHKLEEYSLAKGGVKLPSTVTESEMKVA